MITEPRNNRTRPGKQKTTTPHGTTSETTNYSQPAERVGNKSGKRSDNGKLAPNQVRAEPFFFSHCSFILVPQPLEPTGDLLDTPRDPKETSVDRTRCRYKIGFKNFEIFLFLFFVCPLALSTLVSICQKFRSLNSPAWVCSTHFPGG